jgi:hypothetical protein
MKKLVRCKSCGYVMEEGKLGDVCPACGVPRKMFEAYVDNISAKRSAILKLDIHPVIVHAPQAFSFLVLVLSVILPFAAEATRSRVFDALVIVTLVLPLTVLGALASGILDGAVRFRRVTTPLLMRKLVIGGLFFVLSAAQAALVLAGNLESVISLAAYIALAAASLGAATVQGLIGTRLTNARFPG